MDGGRVRARLASAQGDPPIGAERIAVYHDDGRVEEVTLHDYARVYALPGVYEQIVQEDLGCRSPAQLAGMLGTALDGLARPRGAARVIDIAAGNGVSGEALRAQGIGDPADAGLIVGSDIVPEARAAVLRDRPDTYAEYLTLDLTALTAAQRERLRGLDADALTCVAPVGDRPGAVPSQALATAAALLDGDALVVAMHDPRHGIPDVVTESFWSAHGAAAAECLAHERYLHRFLVTGAPYEMEASVWRVRRPA